MEIEKAKKIYEALRRIFRKILNDKVKLDNKAEAILACNPSMIDLMEKSVKKLGLESELFALPEETIGLTASAISGGYLQGKWEDEYKIAVSLLADVVA